MLDTNRDISGPEPHGQLRRDLALLALVCVIAVLAAVVSVRILVAWWAP